MPDWLAKDFYWKAFSLLMAIGIWLTVRRESEAQPAMPPNVARNTYHDIPVVAVSENADVHQAKLDPQTVTATISGSPDVVNKLQRSQIHAFVNLSGISSAQDLPRDIEISLPGGATIYSIEPSTVTVTLPKP
ncbi:MAG TPA: CdaR family protein [Candidatus Acidoferrum sp.]|nr:CdaR family protein [Candidatus Acidoferrum sp.]